MTFVKGTGGARGGNSEPKSDPMELFLRKVTMEDRHNGCWLWDGGTTKGYGIFTYWDWDGKRYSVRAHRWIYQQLVGPITAATIDHLCRVTNCVNPMHLDPVTQRVNIMRGEGPAAINASKTHCPKNHPYSGDNLQVSKSGKRVCRECHRARCRRYYHRTKVAS